MNKLSWLVDADSLVISTLGRRLDWIGSRVFFRVLQRSQLQVFPLIVVGAVFLCLLNFPFLKDSGIFSATFTKLLQDVVSGTYGVAALVLLCSMSYNFGLIHNKEYSGEYVSPNLFIVISLSCFFVLHGDIDFKSFADIASLGKGIAQAFFVSSFSCYLLHKFIQFRFRLEVSGSGYDIFSREILSLIPACVAVILVFVLLKQIILFSGYSSLSELYRKAVLVVVSLSDSDFLNGLFYTITSQLLWFFGAHGPNSLSFFDSTVLADNLAANIINIQSGMAPTHILTKGFLDNFTMIGGSGLTMSLLIAIFLKGRDSGTKRISQLALLVCLFNVNEPLLFGIPLVLNPVYAIPFLLIPSIAYCLAYAATALGLVPYIVHAVHWTTPVFLNGYLSTGTWAGVWLQVFILGVGVGLYMPFVLISDRVMKKQYDRGMNEIIVAARGEDASIGFKCVGLPGFEGFVARSLASDLVRALRTEEQLYMVFQPQIDDDAGEILGVEALIRWNHPAYGHISPEVVVALAEDMNCIDELSYFVLRESCNQLAVWQERFGYHLFVSVNFPPSLFRANELEAEVLGCLRSAGVPPYCLEIEITESVAMSTSGKELQNLNRLRELGIRISIDDFGMGHTSLRYLRELPIDKVKIDRSLTFGSLNDVNRHIVASILELCRNIEMKVVVEGVENAEQLRSLRKLGGTCFQGYYFSRPITGEDCLRFMDEWNDKHNRLNDSDLLVAEVVLAD
ncbi:EAL domain-containing protein [Maridesulfovibrio sp.]|uniref:EAL domain-containing protein n=1 Tax=Maridesulfovibrio sp. TaxID=2795000 RepID=UPI002A18E086|nr:EAL domain-containing protein [Maridesulfovibrio sp.]